MGRRSQRRKTGRSAVTTDAVPAWSSSRAWMIGLFAAALLLRLLHLASIRDSPYYAPLSLDPLAYDEWGRRIAAGNWLGDRIFYQDPLYPYFLGVAYRIIGHGYARVILVQILLGSLIPPLMFRVTRLRLGFGAAAAGGVLAALYVPSIYYEALILKTWLGAFLVAAALCLVAWAANRAGPAWLAPGAALGLGCLVRGNLLLFLPVLVAWIVLDGRGAAAVKVPPARAPAAQAWKAVAWLLAGAALVLGSTTVRNRIVGGEWVLTTSQGGQNFYIGNNASNRNGRYEPLPFVGANPKFEEKGFATEARRRRGRDLRPTQVSRYWLGEALDWIRSDPAGWLRLTWLKLRNFWGAYEVPDNLDYYLYRQHAPVMRLPLPGFGLVAPLGLVGAWWCIRRRGWPRLLVLFVAVYSSSVVLFFVFSRYRLPMMPALFPLAGVALATLAARIKATRRVRFALAAPAWRQAIAAAGLVAAALAFVNLPVHAPPDQWSFRLAAALHLPLRPENSATGHYNLGLSFARQAEAAVDPDDLLRRAEAEFREAIRQDLLHAAPWAELGKVLARQRRDAEAVQVYQEVARRDPGKARPHHVMGILYRRLGDLGAAETAFRNALQRVPDRVDSATELGQVLLALGRGGEAAAFFRQALRAEPAHAEALAGLEAALGPR